MIEMLLLLIIGPLDAIRGGLLSTRFRFTVKAGVIGYGLAIAALLGHGWDAMTFPLIALFAAGESFGWGEPLGAALDGRPMLPARYERWQVGILTRNAWLALAARGLIWSLPIAVLAPIDWRLLAVVPAFSISMPLAPALVRAANRWRPSGHLWGHQEFVRGWIVAALLWVM